jgi:isopentenyldiphosphate isomerase
MEELLDTFDKNGKFLGVTTRAACHVKNPGFYHKVVWIWIVNNAGEILVQKRALSKKTAPGKWDMPAAGHIDAGETPIESCVRETSEELGINASTEDFVFLKQFVNQCGWELAQIYLLRSNLKVENMKLQTDEVDKVEWLKYDDFVKLIYSDDFCNHEKDYKDWACKILKEKIKQ